MSWNNEPADISRLLRGASHGKSARPYLPRHTHIPIHVSLSCLSLMSLSNNIWSCLPRWYTRCPSMYGRPVIMQLSPSWEQGDGIIAALTASIVRQTMRVSDSGHLYRTLLCEIMHLLENNTGQICEFSSKIVWCVNKISIFFCHHGG